VNINSDYTALDGNMVKFHVQIPVKNKHQQDLMWAVSMDARQNCLLGLAG